MTVIVVANPKGGVGKSTVSTQLAGYLAHQGHQVMLGDIDRQQSSKAWLALRPDVVPKISTWEISQDHIVKPPKGTSHMVLDTPAGLHGKRLDEVMRLADRVLIPLQPSIFDIFATREFIEQIATKRRHGKVSIALVANRVRAGSISSEQLQTFVQTLGLPFLGELRDTQNYIHLAARGLTLWDVTPSRVAKDLEQWQPIIEWLG